MKRILRFILCLIMVFSILVNCSPIRAEAVAATTFALVSGLTVLGSCLIGLGLAAGDNQEAFYEVCTMIAQHPKILPYFDADGNIRIPRFNLEDGELSPWLVPAVLLQAIRGVLKDEEILKDGGSPINAEMEQYIADPVYYGNYVFPRITGYSSGSWPFFVIACNNGTYEVLCCSGGLSYAGISPSLNGHEFYNRSSAALTFVKYVLSDYSWKQTVRREINVNTSGILYGDIIFSSHDIVASDGSLIFSGTEPTDSLLSTDYDLTLFDVAPLDQELAQGYPNWALGQLQDEDEKVWYPLGFGNTLDETLGLTQQQVQLGEGTFEQEQDQEQTQTQIPGLIQGFQDKVTTWFARLSLNQVNILDYLKSIFGQEQKQEHTQAQTQGNQSVDQIIQIIPDDSQDYLAAFGSLVSVVSYEGTAAVITMPALTVPGLPGLFAEKTYLEEQQVDLEAYVNMLPDKLLVLIRALFDAALVLYCLKELFGVIEGVVNNFSDARDLIYE